MKMTFRWYGEKDCIPLSYIKQIQGKCSSHRELLKLNFKNCTFKRRKKACRKSICEPFTYTLYFQLAMINKECV